jgi:LysM repeat protein
MTKTASGLVEYVKGQIGRPYWYGTYGQKATSSLLSAKRKQYPSYYRADDFKNQYGQKVHDCSGLIKGYLMSVSPTASPIYNASFDKSADRFYNDCVEKGDIKNIPDIPGIIVWKKDHIGVYIGDRYVIEARGHSYGVIKSHILEVNWTNWGKLTDIEYIVENKAETVVPDVPTEKTTNYTVKAGDTLSGICGRYGVNMDDVVRWNNISNPNIIHVGQVLSLVGEVNNVVTLTVNANSGLRLRSTPNGTIILVMPNGAKVEKIGADGMWYNVKYNGMTGYCYSEYLK